MDTTQQPAQMPQATPQKTTGGAQHARNFFLYFLSFVLLYLVAISVGGVLFYIINQTMPLVGRIGTESASALRYHLATLIIGTPVFLWLSWKVTRDSKTDDIMRDSGLRKWLTYLTLVVAALVTIGDLIFLVYTLLGGETTLPFILKSLVILGIAGNVFFYYLSDIKFLRSGGTGKHPLPRTYFFLTGGVALAVIVAGLFFIESPVTQRLRNQDGVRVSNLQNLQYQIEEYVRQNNGSLPNSLADITTVREDAKQDPVTKQPLGYRKVNDTSYELCATFATSNRESTGEDYYLYGPDNWLHDVGEACFTRSTTFILNQGGFPKFAPVPN